MLALNNLATKIQNFIWITIYKGNTYRDACTEACTDPDPTVAGGVLLLEGWDLKYNYFQPFIVNEM